MKRKRSPKRGTLDFDDLVARHAAIDAVDEHWCRQGYERSRARAYRKNDGTFTVRLVWRRRSALVSAVTCTLEGLTLA